MRLLGIDLGGRRIGLAVADLETRQVRPLATLRRGRFEEDVERIDRLVAEQRIETVVVGLPLNADGSAGEQALLTRAWAEALAATSRTPVILRDEYGTSEGAEARLGRARRGRQGGPPTPGARARRRALVDRTAAVVLLEEELRARDAGRPGLPIPPLGGAA